MGMFKVAVDEGIGVARNYAPPDGFSPDKQMDLALAATRGGDLGLASLIANAATAPGGHYITGPLRSTGRSILEGLGGAFVGAGGGIGLEAALQSMGVKVPDALLPAVLGGLGAAGGSIHGGYASRRNQREETGDYSTFGFNRDPSRQAVPVL